MGKTIYKPKLKFDNDEEEKIFLKVMKENRDEYKVKSDGKTLEKSINLAMGITLAGKKEILGFWLCENESSSFWLNILNEMKNRGVKQILVASVDGLKGFPEAIKSAFSGTEVQR